LLLINSFPMATFSLSVSSLLIINS
jgi:hypothetical protein